MKKRILFITLDLRYGGTNSSLSNIYSAIKNDYEIDVYSLYNKQVGDYSFKGNVLPSGKLIYWCYSYISDLRGLDKYCAIIIKLLLRLSLLMRLDFRVFLQKQEVKRICKKRKYDLVVGFQEGSATKFASLFHGIKKMAWIHCDYARYYALVNRSELSIYEEFDKIVCVSEYTARSFVSIYPQLKVRTISIYNIFDKERVIELSEATIDDYRFDTTDYTILSVGRIDSVKRFSLIPKIAKKLICAGKSFKWYIIGNVVEDDEYKKLTNEIIENNLENVVVYLGGKRNPYPYFAKSNLFVTTSSSEACPIVFLEAQTFNIPIVSTDFGSASEFIINGINGYIAPLDILHKSILDVMNGRLSYKPKEAICNEIIIRQINRVIGELLEVA